MRSCLNESRRYDEAHRCVSSARAERRHARSHRRSRFASAGGGVGADIRSGELERGHVRCSRRRRALAVGAGFTDVDRAGGRVLRSASSATSQSSIREALSSSTRRSCSRRARHAASDRLRSDIFHWRSRCHRRNRDWVAAQEDIERALELAEACADDTRRAADALFQASLVAQRQGAGCGLERTPSARVQLFEELGDRATAARLLNNLAGLDHLLGDDDRGDRAARTSVRDLRRRWISPVDARLRLLRRSRRSGSPATSSQPAESTARKALELLGGRVDHLQEIGIAQLMPRGALARARAELGRRRGMDRGRGRRPSSRRARLGHRSYRVAGARRSSRASEASDRDAAGSLPAGGAGRPAGHRL